MLSKSDFPSAWGILGALKENNWDKAKVADEVLKCSYSFVRDVFDAFYGVDETIAIEAINTGRTYAEVIEEKQVEACKHLNGYLFRRYYSIDIDKHGVTDKESREFIVDEVEPTLKGYALIETITFSDNPKRWMKTVFLTLKNKKP